ncbi:MAG: hypothetical protein Q9187_002255 [Circinaria calcarea]
MQALICHNVWSISKRSALQSCRVIGGRRFPTATRFFRSPSSLRLPQDDSTDTGEPTWNSTKSTPGTSNSESPQELEEVTENGDHSSATGTAAEEGSGNAAGREAKLKDMSSYGSSARRALRNIKKIKDQPRYVVPPWFLDRNVVPLQDLLKEDIPRLNILDSSGKSQEQALDFESEANHTQEDDSTNGAAGRSTKKSIATETADLDSYDIDGIVFEEIAAMVSAGLRPPAPRYADTYPASKPHLMLQCPKDGGMLFLDTVVKYIAIKREADLVQIDAQDIAQIGGDSIGESPGPVSSKLKSIYTLGYDTHLLMARNNAQDEDEDQDEIEDGEELDDDHEQQPRNKQQGFPSVGKSTVMSMPLITFTGSLTDIFKSSKIMGDGALPGSSRSLGQQPQLNSVGQNPAMSEDAKVSLLIEALLDAAQIKGLNARTRFRRENATSAEEVSVTTSGEIGPSADVDTPSLNDLDGSSNGLILMIRDYAEMYATSVGIRVLSKIHDVVQRRRKDGQRILIVGTTSSENLIPSMSKTGFKSLQNEAQFEFGPNRTIVIPCRSSSADTIFASDEKLRVKQINLRHLLDMIRRLAPDVQSVHAVISQPNLELDSAQIFASGMDEDVWPFEVVHRTALVALGLMKDAQEMNADHLNRALILIRSSDAAKFDWIADEKGRGKKSVGLSATVPSTKDAKKDMDERIRKLRKSCNTHEKKLLNGVVDAENIKTTFADVRAPAETIEALKMLTSLSLVRPEAFTYGVLATDKIPGLLLYGPPGTGKTLLAKAVAKESGATVLEVSGSDIYDMYVGEGEKNVKAIFTLAKKLTPCVVFIDEADSIFGSRGTSTNRTSHRELINQFLREWDGMNDLSAFIMVATNRPFDLDDAVLRRLPRRLLIDLPTEKDREAILAIHLKDEILDPSVSLSALASQTPFYSGSDLKNLSVAAALACVREENDSAAAHTGHESHQYPEKRILGKRHFDKAMEEISASISEDMSSLGAIRKFDERFGDRRGRRKRSGGYGFGTLTEAEKDREGEVRVRS